MLKDFQVRVIARACITRCDIGEGDIRSVVSSYNLDRPDCERVEAYVYSQRPDIEPKE